MANIIQFYQTVVVLSIIFIRKETNMGHFLNEVERVGHLRSLPHLLHGAPLPAPPYVLVVFLVLNKLPVTLNAFQSSK